ncbi:MAG: universal stress protein [Pyrinomonadaceae bacterium]|nr:universal stress protein [Acidobacteriota bacterium]MBK7932466.1 universal stress protein [Acidobacteriota bacterium]MBP7375598.1 universal stress protein [Pyrinomonadaceae bacterium]
MRILIATDGSDYSKAAVEQACRLVINPLNAEILIVSAYEDTYPITAEPFAVSAEYYQQVEAAVRDQAGVFVEDAKKAIQDKFQGSGLVISTEVLRGSPDQEILNKAKEWNADLIVVGSHGRGFWGRLLGSVSNGVVHHAPCSVLVVRQ